MSQRGRSRRAYLDAGFAALAHRGGVSPEAPIEIENSLRAFEAAWRLGYAYLETDVHATSDGVLIAFHDTTLDRTTDAVGVIADLPWAEVSRARIGGLEPIPRLDDLLDALPHARLNIDIKAAGATESLAATLDAHAAHERVCVGSFSTARIARFRRLSAGRVATAASPVEIAVAAWLPGIRRVWPLTADVFQVPVREERTGAPIVTRSMVSAAHARGAAVHTWTINDRAEMERLIDLGVDGLVTDDIATLKTVLVERNLWEDNA